MRISLIAAFTAVLALGYFVRAEEKPADSKDVKVSGVLIDQMCGAKMVKKDDPQKAAEEHQKDCCLKCADHGFAVMSDGKMTKLSSDSSDKVKEYLAKQDAKTTVSIDGVKQDDGSISVKEISAKS